MTFFPLSFTPRLHLSDASRCPKEGANGDIVYWGRQSLLRFGLGQEEAGYGCGRVETVMVMFSEQ